MENTDQTEQDQTNENLNVDFSHRLSGGSSLLESIGLMTERAGGILHLLAGHLEGVDGNVFMSGAVDAVIQEIEDIRSTLIAHNFTEHVKTKV